MNINDTIVEEQIIASIIWANDEDISVSNAIIATGALTEECFIDSNLRRAYEVIVSILKDHSIPDVAHITSRLNDSDLMAMLSTVATTTDVTSLCEQQKGYYSARKMQLVSSNTLNTLNNRLDTLESLDYLRSELMKVALSDVATSKDEGSLGDYVGTFIAEQSKRKADAKAGGITTGVSTVDQSITGMKRGEIIVIGGRSGMGKSSLAMTMIAKQIMDGYKPALFSFELNRYELTSKLISLLSEFDPDGMGIPFKSIFNPYGGISSLPLSPEMEVRQADIISKYLHESKIFFRGASRLTVEGVMATARRLKAEGRLDILYLDHLGLLVQDKNMERQELTHITNSLKLFANEIGVPIVEVVQLNRGADTVSEKPKKSHLKGSGSIEEDADIILMPWRPFSIRQEGDPSESEIIVAKGRNAGEGTIPTYFNTKSTSFTPLSKYDREHKSQEKVGIF